MENYRKEDTICVLTARGIEKILEDEGSQSWVLDSTRASKCGYVVCVQNCVPDDWGHASAPHHSAFLVGRLQNVVRSTEDERENRWLLKFSEYAEIDIPNSWPGYRNPVMYTTLKEFGIDINSLNFQPVPKQEPPMKKVSPLTISEAKLGLAMALGIDPSNIEITIRS